MLPYKKILCPTDFSDLSNAALRQAGALAEQLSAELLIVHVIWQASVMHPSATPANLPAHLFQMRQSAQDAIERILEQKIPPGIKVRSIIAEGSPAEQITDIAEKECVDLLVMSTHGETGWRRVLMGSVAEGVLRLARCPVLLIPGTGE